MPGRRALSLSALWFLGFFLTFPQQAICFPGQSGQPSVNYPQSLQLSDILVGKSGTFVIGLINQGNANWIIDSVTATADFSTSNPSSPNCQSPIIPISQSSGGYLGCQLWITFTPSAVGQRSGTLTITDNVAGSPHVIPLTASGVSFYSSPGIWIVQAIPTDTPNPFLLITGNGFFPDSQINVNNWPRTTVYLSGQGLAAVLTAADLAQPAEVQVTVTNPSPGGTSNSAPAVIYQPIRKVTIRHSVFEPHSGLLYASADPTSATDPGQVLVIDPTTGQITNHFSVGNGPNQLAVSDDGSFLYVGLDADNTVAQVAIPAGTVNFAVSLGTNPNPLVAHALRVLPGTSDSWAVVLTCAAINISPCNGAVAVFDGEVMRPTEFQGGEPDYLLFLGGNAATLFGTTNSPAGTPPSIFYQFAINSSGITESQMVENFQSTSPGGGVLDTDGTSIYVSNGQIIDPNTLAITSTLTVADDAGIRVDAPNSHVYFAGGAISFQPAFTNATVEAFSPNTQQPTGLVYLPEVFPATPSLPEIFRWGSDGLAINAGNAVYLMHTSLTSAAAPPAQPFVSNVSPATVAAGSPALPLTITGGGLSASDTLTANGEPLTVAATSNPFIQLSELTATITAALLSVPGEVQLVLTDTSGHAMYEDMIVTPSGSGSSIALSTNDLTFGPQLLTSSSTAQTLKISNSGSTAIQVSGVTVSGDFSQANNCTAIAPGASCSVMVTFKPSADGARTGLLTINDSDVSQTQSVALNGTGADVQVTGSRSGGTSASVASGQTATYNLNLTPTPGLTGQATLSCANLPTDASCTINPSSFDLSKGATSVTVMIATSSQQTAALQRQDRPRWKDWIQFPAVALFPLLVLCFLNGARRRKTRWPRWCCSVCRWPWPVAAAAPAAPQRLRLLQIRPRQQAATP
jgi:hypothetical protein